MMNSPVPRPGQSKNSPNPKEWTCPIRKLVRVKYQRTDRRYGVTILHGHVLPVHVVFVNALPWQLSQAIDAVRDEI